MRNFRLFVIASLLAAASSPQASEFVGSDSCQGCHAEEHAQWQGSHHDLAMQEATPDTVLGDFNDRRFDYHGVSSRFFREGDSYFVETDGEDGQLARFPVEYVFGVYPLQQYLIPLSRGRLQALSIAWDARPASEGGQRWYHLYPEEAIDHRDPLHWTGPYQNWNTRCAECHSTDLQKNYSATTRSFATTYAELDVGCEACHGPGRQHLQLAQKNKLEGAALGGFPISLAQRGEWAFAEGESIARRREALRDDTQIDTCARCHARRGTLGDDYHYGADLLDTHRLSLPLAPLYYHDGQIRDEVYVYGSFVQSRMHQAGVVCSNCHEPHSLALRAPDNGVCAQCHEARVYDAPQHHHHTAASTGALCANCHMPETTYMGVDPRRDHSMRIPRPDLGPVLGTPDACTACHTDRDQAWASAALERWGASADDRMGERGKLFQLAARGDSRVTPLLAQLAADTDEPVIWRAAAMEVLGEFGGREAMHSVSQLLYDDDPQLRVSTIRALEFLPLHQRFQLLRPLFEDEVTLVRMEVARLLAAVPLEQIDAADAKQLATLFDEYLALQAQHADMPSVQLQLGAFLGQRGDTAAAEAAYREALQLNPQLLAGYLNLADLLRGANRQPEARELLLQALEVVPENGAALHSLGLLETRAGNGDKALDYLRRAAEVERDGSRYRYVYAIALHDMGQPRQALRQLQALLRQDPGNRDVLLALANYHAELKETDKARYYAESLLRLAPDNRNYQQLYQSLSQPQVPLAPR